MINGFLIALCELTALAMAAIMGVAVGLDNAKEAKTAFWIVITILILQALLLLSRAGL